MPDNNDHTTGMNTPSKGITMLYLYVTLQTLGTTLTQNARDRLDSDRGSVTIEQVLWAVAVIGIVGVVVAAVKAFVDGKAREIG